MNEIENTEVVVTEPVEVQTLNSAYRVTPVREGGFSGYRVEKIKELSEDYKGDFPVGYFIESDTLFLEKGKRMIVGTFGFSTSKVLDIKYLKPHH